MSSWKQAELRRLMKLQIEKKKQEETIPKSILKASRKTDQPSGVSSLLTGYDSDDDDDDSPSTKEEKSRVTWPEDDFKLKTTHIIDRPQSSNHANRFADDSLIEPTTNQVESDAPAGAETVGPAGGSTETANLGTRLDLSVGEEIWNEFEAFLNEETNKSEPDETEEEPVETFEDSRIDTTEMEQASYEARIAQLRLRAAARRKKQVSVVQTIDTYTPELAEGGETWSSSDDTMTPIEILRRKKRAKIQAENDDS